MSNHQITFEAGTRTLLGFGIAFAAVLAVFIPLGEIASTYPVWVWYLQEVILFVVIAALTLLLVRLDGIRLDDIGLSREHLIPAILAFGGIYVGLNVVGLGLATVFNLPWGFDFITNTVPAQFASLPASWVLFILLQFFVGLVEEFALRGYFQNKVIAFLGDGTRVRITLGIVAASVVFGLLHAPGALLADATIVGVLGVVGARALTGVFFGTFYELTRNVYFVALLHGLGNTWPLIIDWNAWSGTALTVFFVGVALLYFGMTLGYRSWATDTELTPTGQRTDSGNWALLS